MINCKNKIKNTFSKYKQQFSDIKKSLFAVQEILEKSLRQKENNTRREHAWTQRSSEHQKRVLHR